MKKPNSKAVEILSKLEAKGGVLGSTVREVSAETGVPEAEVWGAGTFYGLLAEPGARHRVCNGLSCRLAESTALQDRLRARGLSVETVSCLGQCDRAPAVLDETLEPFEMAASSAGVVLPDDPTLPINLGGADETSYEALAIARSMDPEHLMDILETSGLSGRGGAGFPAHMKWRAVRGQRETRRVLVVNADEGEPGTFKDRTVLLRRPHRLLEGLAIAACCVGAREVHLYVRGEFREAERSLLSAIEVARGLSSDPMKGLSVQVHRGHGAYICGEETALLESIEGGRGQPRIKPPFPTQVGLFGLPTLIHNVETLACVPTIIRGGGEAFRTLGLREAGTRLYSLSGAVVRPGVYELPSGVTLDELVSHAGGFRGLPLAFSPGGASSGFLPMSERKRPLDAQGLREVGSMLGSAGVVVIPAGQDLARLVEGQLAFFEHESCGQCAPCRIGTRWLRLRVSEYLRSGDPGVLSGCEDVGWELREGSICGLGMVAAAPLESARRHFPDAFGVRASRPVLGPGKEPPA